MVRPSFLEPEAERLLAERGVSVEAYTAWVMTEGARRATAAAVVVAIVIAIVLASVTTVALKPSLAGISVALRTAAYVPTVLIPGAILWRGFTRKGAAADGSDAEGMLARAATSYGTAKFMHKRLRYEGWNQVIAFAKRWELERAGRSPDNPSRRS